MPVSVRHLRPTVKPRKTHGITPSPWVSRHNLQYAHQSGYPFGFFLCQAQAVATMSSSFGYLGFQPSSRMAFSADATSRGGSPGRRSFSTVGIFLPVTFSQV